MTWFSQLLIFADEIVAAASDIDAARIRSVFVQGIDGVRASGLISTVESGQECLLSLAPRIDLLLPWFTLAVTA